jgi:hypothetical protein
VNPNFSDEELRKKFSYLGKYVKPLFTDISVMASFVTASVSHAAFTDCTN